MKSNGLIKITATLREILENDPRRFEAHHDAKLGAAADLVAERML